MRKKSTLHFFFTPGILMQKKKKQLEMCQDDTDAPTQGHPHPHADILQKKNSQKRWQIPRPHLKWPSFFSLGNQRIHLFNSAVSDNHHNCESDIEL